MVTVMMGSRISMILEGSGILDGFWMNSTVPSRCSTWYTTVGAVVISVWIAVRLSLAAPMTFAERKLRVFESWKATKGRFWSLFGVYFLAGIMGLLVMLLGWVVTAAFSMAFGGGMSGFMSLIKPDFTSLSGYFSPVMIVRLAISSLLSAIYYAVALAPVAVAYQALSGRADIKTFE